MRGGIICALLTVCLAATGRTVPAVMYVDDTAGSDAAEGLTPDRAWKTLDRVNREPLIPGDRVLFRRGGVWRGQLVPRSGTNGAAVTYGAYGTGAKPVLQGSVARDRREEWVCLHPGIWATPVYEPEALDQLADLKDSRWSLHAEASARAHLSRREEDGRGFNRVVCDAPGSARNHIQLWGAELDGFPSPVLLRLRVRSSIPFRLDEVEALLNRPPYTRTRSGHVRSALIGKEWRTVEAVLYETATGSGAHLHLSLGEKIPAGAVFDFEPLGLWRLRPETRHAPIPCDVGILLLDHGVEWGVKKWRPEDLVNRLDYWYDGEGQRVVLVCETNPAVRYASIELALTRTIVLQANCRDVTYEGLAVRYGGAHGFGGSRTQRITIRQCDLSWIGGGLQDWRKRKGGERFPVRYGNAIEFWNGAEDHVVESNRIWEIYDAALTNQGHGDDSRQMRIRYRHNVIWNAEYSFEFWNRPETARSEHILFEYNTCVDAGSGWAHKQRPDPNGAHLMFYLNSSATTNVVIRNNLFVGTTEVCMRMENDWRGGLSMRNNLYWPGDKPFLRWLGKTFFEAGGFTRYQRELALDSNSLLAEPKFMNPAARDYRLCPDSPGARLATDGGPVGARW
ncbi:MAG TPA: hypothetical protein PK770_04855 [Kiritimatiellia bacterium]|jgi:hypothetical protein|nr:hypothetical protein [Kiritimatiellia bacterium]HOM59176.1 hypothetical protein [Kiritimatiellia bacterium]HOR98362.1 hypothetical protein [Kiritimatiellia bacterium]